MPDDHSEGVALVRQALRAIAAAQTKSEFNAAAARIASARLALVGSNSFSSYKSAEEARASVDLKLASLHRAILEGQAASDIHIQCALADVAVAGWEKAIPL
jgi:hypothetical protein